MLKKFSNRIYYYEGEERTDRPYLYYIRGDWGSAVIDAGNSRRHVESFYAALTEMGLPLPDYTVITHWHWDHTFGLPYVQGKTVASALTNQKLRQVMGWVWTPEAMDAREKTGEDIAFCNRCIRIEYENLQEITVCPAQEEVEDRSTIDLGGIHLELFAADSPHSRDSLYIYIPEEKALAVGDAACEDFYDNDGKFDPEKLRALLAFFQSLNFSFLLEGHCAPEDREGMLAYLKEQLITKGM